MLRTSITLAIAIFTATPALRAQQVQVDQKSGTWSYLSANGGKPVALTGGETIRIDSRDSLQVKVVNSNSALYACTLDQAESKVPELEAFRAALTTFGPYLSNVLSLATVPQVSANVFGMTIDRDKLNMIEDSMRGGSGRSDQAERARRAAEAALRAMDDYLFGPQGLNATRLAVFDALNGMRTAEGDRILGLATGVRTAACPAAGCGSQTLASRAVTLLSEAAEAHRNLRPYVETLPLTGPGLNASLGKLQSDAEALTATAYRTEQLVRIVAEAKPEVECGAVRVRQNSGRSLSIAVGQRGMAETDRVATLPARKLKLEAQPRFRIRPTAGLAFLYVPRASYAVPGTKTFTGGPVIDSVSTQDSRFTFAVTLGVALTDRVGPVQLPFSIGPEVVANPSTDTRAIGVGLGGTVFSAIKFGAGVLWTRHKVLSQGQQFGQTLPAADHLRTRDTYGRGRFYFGGALTAWPLVKL
ncbi:MAG TPA: hypothetical protein VF584_02750 [Longimicrobium sp.]|jgi:hypothetical protein